MQGPVSCRQDATEHRLPQTGVTLKPMKTHELHDWHGPCYSYSLVLVPLADMPERSGACTELPANGLFGCCPFMKGHIE